MEKLCLNKISCKEFLQYSFYNFFYVLIQLNIIFLIYFNIFYNLNHILQIFIMNNYNKIKE